MRHVLVTHLDSAVGRRLMKALYHDPDVALVLGTGIGPRPSFLDAYREKCAYERLDLARARHLTSFFRSERFARARIDSVIHLPFVSDSSERIPGNVASLVSETRRLLEECKKRRGIERFIYLSSAFVYRPEPGNVNVFSEGQLLGFEADGDLEVRAWIDADLTCQGELNDPHLRMTILRAATIVTEKGEFLQCPPLHGTPQIGFDPMFSLVADRDVARALVLALHGDRPGVYNISGTDTFPFSDLRRDDRVRIGPVPLPGILSSVRGLVEQALGQPRRSPFTRYGVVLNTRRAREALGYEPQYRIEIRGRGAERRVDTVRSR